MNLPTNSCKAAVNTDVCGLKGMNCAGHVPRCEQPSLQAQDRDWIFSNQRVDYDQAIRVVNHARDHAAVIARVEPSLETSGGGAHREALQREAPGIVVVGVFSSCRVRVVVMVLVISSSGLSPAASQGDVCRANVLLNYAAAWPSPRHRRVCSCMCWACVMPLPRVVAALVRCDAEVVVVATPLPRRCHAVATPLPRGCAAPSPSSSRFRAVATQQPP